MDAVRLVATGPPGQGASTFLNEIANEGEKFRTAAGMSQGTVAGDKGNVFTKEGVVLGEDEKGIAVEMIDTPGIPYPDASQNEANWNDLVEKCKRPLNGVVIVINPERKNLEQLKIQAESFKGLQELKCKVFIVANSFEPCKRNTEEEDAYTERRESGRKNYLESANDFKAAAGLQSAGVLVSYCLDDLEQAGREVLRGLRGSPQVASALSPLPRDTPKESQPPGADAPKEAPREDGDAPKAEPRKDGSNYGAINTPATQNETPPDAPTQTNAFPTSTHIAIGGLGLLVVVGILVTSFHK